jgi:hypothetical protein
MAHDITVINGITMCRKCGRTAAQGFPITCVGQHDIADIGGKIMCRKCGRTAAQGFPNTCP